MHVVKIPVTVMKRVSHRRSTFAERLTGESDQSVSKGDELRENVVDEPRAADAPQVPCYLQQAIKCLQHRLMRIRHTIRAFIITSMHATSIFRPLLTASHAAPIVRVHDGTRAHASRDWQSTAGAGRTPASCASPGTRSII